MSKAFAARLRALRKRADMTQEGLARAADVSHNTVSKLEQGNGEPTWATVQALAKALGVSTDDFRDDAPVIPEPSEDGKPDRPARKKPRK